MYIYKNLDTFDLDAADLDTILIALVILSLTMGVTLLTIWNSFGPDSKNLIDPFEEDED